jgi:hypothetical protein
MNLFWITARGCFPALAAMTNYEQAPEKKNV